MDSRPCYCSGGCGSDILASKKEVKRQAQRCLSKREVFSHAITEWLDEQFPDTVKLYPSGVWERCQVKMWQQWEMALAEDFWLMFYTNTLGFVYRAMYLYQMTTFTLPHTVLSFQNYITINIKGMGNNNQYILISELHLKCVKIYA